MGFSFWWTKTSPLSLPPNLAYFPHSFLPICETMNYTTWNTMAMLLVLLYLSFPVFVLSLSSHTYKIMWLLDNPMLVSKTSWDMTQSTRISTRCRSTTFLNSKLILLLSLSLSGSMKVYNLLKDKKFQMKKKREREKSMQCVADLGWFIVFERAIVHLWELEHSLKWVFTLDILRNNFALRFARFEGWQAL